MSYSTQINKYGGLNHLLTIEGISRDYLIRILDRANKFLSFGDNIVLKNYPVLKGRCVFNIFFENSTRTSSTFEIAARRLSADVMKLNISGSSSSKGESLLDTVDNLVAMQADMFIVRHSCSGAVHLIANHVNRVSPNIQVLNAGDGCHSHPTQALLDMYTIRFFKKNFRNLRVAIIGDISHSRVARSDIWALSILGVPDIRVISPNTLLPMDIEQMGVTVFSDLNKGLKDVDVVIVLRLQNERISSPVLPSAQEYFKFYGLTENAMKNCDENAIILHPGPMNRGVEIDSKVADSASSVILKQVTFGIAIRMAVMDLLHQEKLERDNG